MPARQPRPVHRVNPESLFARSKRSAHYAKANAPPVTGLVGDIIIMLHSRAPTTGPDRTVPQYEPRNGGAGGEAIRL